MPWDKKSKKSLQPSKQLMSLGIPTQIVLGFLGIDADLAPNPGPEGVSPFMKPRSSRELILPPRQAQTMEVVLELWSQTVVWVTNPTRWMLQPSDARRVQPVGALYCSRWYRYL